MHSENWKKVKALLGEALEVDARERQAFLQNSGETQQVIAEVESLLEFEDASNRMMNLAAVEFSKEFFDGNVENPHIGRQIGNYKIIGELGQGGMGAVYQATRADGKFEQKVALKLLKREMNTAALRRRFQHEREILATLEHPNIARLLDAGTTDDGIPFIAMEYIEGLPIDEYCERQRLDLNKRLDLFRKVCAAVDFAHRNLVVHRDLKPSNILVTEDGTPKLLDFGISKILSPEFENTDSATVTKLGVMTPGYASPEQLQGKSVTTATDIYSLGVILYELLSGRRPFEARNGDWQEVYQSVIEKEPPRPSSVVSRPVFVDKKETSENRLSKTESKTVPVNAKALSGDLDNIILKSLRKEPERRYSSAENFAEDIHRHQRGLPVAARPNTFFYRAEKFFQRNRISVTVGVLLLLAIAFGIIATLWQSRIAQAERDRARLEAEKSAKINSFLQNVLTLSNPLLFSENPDSKLKATIAEAIDKAAVTIESELAGQPEIQAEIHYTLGKTYLGQGQYEKAKAQLEKAREKFLQVTPEDLSKVMQIKAILGTLYSFEGGTENGEKLLLESVAYFREDFKKKKESRFWLAMTLSDLGIVVARNGKIDESESLIREALSIGSELEGQERWLLLNIKGNLGDILVEQGKTDEAINLYKSAIDDGGKLTNKPSVEIGGHFYDLGRVYKRLEKYPEARENVQKAYEIFSQTIGEETIYTSMSRKQIAELYYLSGDFQKARSEIDEVIKTVAKVVPEKPNLYETYSLEVLANILTATGEPENAEKIMRDVLAAYSKLLKSPNVDIATAKRSLGEALSAGKKFAEAKRILTEAEKEFIETVGEDDPQTKRCRELLQKVSL